MRIHERIFFVNTCLLLPFAIFRLPLYSTWTTRIKSRFLQYIMCNIYRNYYTYIIYDEYHTHPSESRSTHVILSHVIIIYYTYMRIYFLRIWRAPEIQAITSVVVVVTIYPVQCEYIFIYLTFIKKKKHKHGYFHIYIMEDAPCPRCMVKAFKKKKIVKVLNCFHP